MANRSGSSRGTDPQRLIELSAEHQDPSTSVELRLTFPQGVPRWIKRGLVALLVWALTAVAGQSTLTFVQGLL